MKFKIGDVLKISPEIRDNQLNMRINWFNTYSWEVIGVSTIMDNRNIRKNLVLCKCIDVPSENIEYYEGFMELSKSHYRDLKLEYLLNEI